MKLLNSNKDNSTFQSIGIQPNLLVNFPNNTYEQEADAIADRVMRMPLKKAIKPDTGLIGKSLQRKCTNSQEEEKRSKPIMRKVEGSNSGISVSSSFASTLNASKGGGSLLPEGTKSFMENAFSSDFSKVKIHKDGQAAELSKGINAKAFTYGDDIFFNSGQYLTENAEGRKLLAHELVHVIQQKNNQIIQRTPDPTAEKPPIDPIVEIESLLAQKFTDSKEPRLFIRKKRLLELFDKLNFGAAYALAQRLTQPRKEDVLVKNFNKLSTTTREELILFLYYKIDILSSVVGILTDFQGTNFCNPFTKEEIDAGLDLEMIFDADYLINHDIRDYYGNETANLWDQYISRSQGDSLTPEIFDNPSNEIVVAFVNHVDTQKRQKKLLTDLKIAIINNCPSLRPDVWTDIDIASLLPESELNSPFSFSSVFTIPGLIAGGVSGSDAGPDSRQISGKVQLFLLRSGQGDATVNIRTKFQFSINDAIDFCPGGMGSFYARVITIPLSRLEASGWAYDMPFIVNYEGSTIEESLSSSEVNKCYKN